MDVIQVIDRFRVEGNEEFDLENLVRISATMGFFSRENSSTQWTIESSLFTFTIDYRHSIGHGGWDKNLSISIRTWWR